MQSNLCVHTKYENMDKIYLYPIWEFFIFFRLHIIDSSKILIEYWIKSKVKDVNAYQG